jgi:hypothetical protein
MSVLENLGLPTELSDRLNPELLLDFSKAVCSLSEAFADVGLRPSDQIMIMMAAFGRAASMGTAEEKLHLANFWHSIVLENAGLGGGGAC